MASAKRTETNETPAGYESEAALREALFGNLDQALQRSAAARKPSTGRDVQFGVALALSLAGNADESEVLADNLEKRFPEDSIVQFNYLPATRAQVALDRKHSAKAIDILRNAAPYGAFTPGLDSVYVRGQAKRPHSFRKSSTIAGLLGTNPSVRSPNLSLAAPTPFKQIPLKRKPPIRTCSLFGKTPTPTSPF